MKLLQSKQNKAINAQVITELKYLGFYMLI